MRSKHTLRFYRLVLLLAVMGAGGIGGQPLHAAVVLLFAGGSGSADDPYLVATAEHLDNVRNHLNSYFRQVADIDLGVAPWNEGVGWVPVGDNINNQFQGHYDGLGHRISNLTIESHLDQTSALFGRVGQEGVVRSLHLENVDIWSIGAAGGLIGYNRGAVANCRVTGNIQSINSVGGLIGYNVGVVYDCVADVSVVGTGMNIGGLIGKDEAGEVNRCRAQVDIVGEASYVGGLIGSALRTRLIRDCQASGTIGGQQYVGGLAGQLDEVLAIEHSRANVRATGIRYVGGLVGYTKQSNGYYCQASGNVFGERVVGGFSGAFAAGTFRGCQAAGNVSGVDFVGGFMGEASGLLQDCHATGSISALRNYVGGLIGANRATVTNCFATGSVNASSSYSTGGLVGLHLENQISHSYAIGAVEGDMLVGGLVGECETNTVVQYSYATGAVVARSPDQSEAGGLVGVNLGSIKHCHALGSVSADWVAGGLVGGNYGTVNGCYASGGVNSQSWLGGLVGIQNEGVAAFSFWDRNRSGTDVSEGGIGYTTAQMYQQASYILWDFDDTWSIDEGESSPWLQHFAMRPTTNALLDTCSPLFQWRAQPGMTAYQLWIQRDGEAYITPWVGNAVQWQPEDGFPGGDYQWWVRGWGADVGMGEWSTGNVFRIEQEPPAQPIQLLSGDLPSHDVTFMCFPDARSTWLRLWVSHPEGGTWHGEWYRITGDEWNAISVAAHPGGASDWWARAWGPSGMGEWAGPKSFTTPIKGPGKPVAVAPSGAVAQQPITFEYLSTQSEWYRIVVRRIGDGNVLDEWTQMRTYDAGQLPAGNYRWWVGAWNRVTDKVVWSEPVDFSIE